MQCNPPPHSLFSLDQECCPSILSALPRFMYARSSNSINYSCCYSVVTPTPAVTILYLLQMLGLCCIYYSCCYSVVSTTVVVTLLYHPSIELYGGWVLYQGHTFASCSLLFSFCCNSIVPCLGPCIPGPTKASTTALVCLLSETAVIVYQQYYVVSNNTCYPVVSMFVFIRLEFLSV